MPHPLRVLVIGAAGNQGGGVVRHCVAAGHIVRALLRNRESDKATQLEREHAIELVEGDVDDIESIRRGFNEIDAVFFIITQAGIRLEAQRTRNVISAVRSSRTTSTIVFSTALWTGQHGIFPEWSSSHSMYENWTAKHEGEEMVRSSGVKHWVIVRPAMFLQDFVLPISSRLFPDLAKSGNLRVGFKKENRINFVDGSDVGLVVATAISNPEQYSGQTIELSLPPLAIQDIANAMDSVRGSNIRVTYANIDELAAEQGERLIAAQRLFRSLGYHAYAERFSYPFRLTQPDQFFQRISR